MCIDSILYVLGHQDSATSGSKTITLWPKSLGVTELAVDIAIGTVAQHHRVQRAMALTAAVAALVPFLHTEIRGTVINQHISVYC